MENVCGTNFIVKESSHNVNYVGRQDDCSATTGSTSGISDSLSFHTSEYDINMKGESIHEVLSDIDVPQLMEKIIMEKKLSLMKSPDVVNFLRNHQRQCEQRTSKFEKQSNDMENGLP